MSRVAHYGLELGDLVECRGIRGEVVEFDPMDNNRAILKLEDGTMYEAVAEWCAKIPVLTEEETAAGWKIERCPGNGYRPSCGRLIKRLDWCTPSGCPHCNATFVD